MSYASHVTHVHKQYLNIDYCKPLNALFGKELNRRAVYISADFFKDKYMIGFMSETRQNSSLTHMVKLYYEEKDCYTHYRGKTTAQTLFTSFHLSNYLDGILGR